MKWSDCFFNKAFSLKVPKADTPPTKSVQRLKKLVGKNPYHMVIACTDETKRKFYKNSVCLVFLCA